MSCTSNDIYLGQMICTATIEIEPGPYSVVVMAQAWSSNGPKMQATQRVFFSGIL